MLFRVLPYIFCYEIQRSFRNMNFSEIEIRKRKHSLKTEEREIDVQKVKTCQKVRGEKRKDQ